MSDSSLIPEGENLRRAIQWISEQNKHDAKTIESASVQFDLTPLEEAFLMRHFRISKAKNSTDDWLCLLVHSWVGKAGWLIISQGI